MQTAARRPTHRGHANGSPASLEVVPALALHALRRVEQLTSVGGMTIVDDLVAHPGLYIGIDSVARSDLRGAARIVCTSELALTQAQALGLVSGVPLYKALGGVWSDSTSAR